MRTRSPAVVAALLTAALSGCGDGVSGEDCLPGLPTVAPAAVAAGGQLTLTSTGSACDARYDDGERYQLELFSLGRADPLDLGEVEVALDGSFSTTVTVPVDASPGGSAVSVAGSPYDESCEDTGSCAGYSVTLTVLPAP